LDVRFLDGRGLAADKLVLLINHAKSPLFVCHSQNGYLSSLTKCPDVRAAETFDAITALLFVPWADGNQKPRKCTKRAQDARQADWIALISPVGPAGAAAPHTAPPVLSVSSHALAGVAAPDLHNNLWSGPLPADDRPMVLALLDAMNPAPAAGLAGAVSLNNNNLIKSMVPLNIMITMIVVTTTAHDI
jgi:hypothetical protein